MYAVFSDFYDLYAEYGAYLYGAFIFILLVWAFYAVCKWRIFTRCGMPGWMGIIPVFNKIMLGRHLGCVTIGVISAIAGVFTLLPLVTWVFIIISTVTNVILQCRLALYMRRPGWFGILVLVPIVYYPLMAFTGQSPESWDTWNED